LWQMVFHLRHSGSIFQKGRDDLLVRSHTQNLMC
jgi:hypothetical protein